MLFQADMGKQVPDAVRKTFWAERKEVTDDVRGFADDLFRTATDRTLDIDKLIEGHAEHWRMERMAVDRNICAAPWRSFCHSQTPRAVVLRSHRKGAKVFHSGVGAVHQWRARQCGAGSGKGSDVGIRTLSG